MDVEEVRTLVQTYYRFQKMRTASANRLRTIEDPSVVSGWLLDQTMAVELTIKGLFEEYVKSHELGQWCTSQYGLGPVITAGLMAYIDVSKAGHPSGVWRYAGLDPTADKRVRGQKLPYNADLKTLMWKLGDSFVKFHNQDDCYYGKLYEQRKAIEVRRNEAGDFAPTAARTLTEKKIVDKETRATYEAGRLPDGRIDLRARRWAVKIFLAHYFQVAWEIDHNGASAPTIHAIAHGGHADYIPPPNWPMEAA